MNHLAILHYLFKIRALLYDTEITNGGKQRKLYNCPHYIVQHWKATRTLNSSYLYICRYSFAPIPISQSVEGTISVVPHPYAQTLFLHLYLWLLLRCCSVWLSETGQHMPLLCVYRIIIIEWKMTTNLHVRVIFLLKLVLEAHSVNVR
jgi:hypothetical protein